MFRKKCLDFLDNHIKELSRPFEAQNKIFRDIVVRNKNTEFAKKMGFSQSQSFDEFRQSAKLTCYDDYEVFIKKTIKGNSNQLTQGDPYMFLKTSGTTGKSKIIPQNKHWRSYRAKAIYTGWGLYEKLFPNILKDWQKIIDLSWQRKVPDSFLGEFPYQSVTNRQCAISDQDWLPPWYDENWFEPSGKGLNLHAENVLVQFLNVDVFAIVVVNPSTIILLNQILRENSEKFLDQAYLKENTDIKQLDYLRLLIKRNGFLTLSDIWPNLKLISCWKSGGASLYLNSVYSLFPKVTIVPFSSLGTEGVVAIAVDEHPSAMPLAVNQGLFEFIPQDQTESSAHDIKPLKFDELDIGKTYQLVMTQANGFCRYNVDDFYKVVDYYGGIPRIEYVGRGSSIHSFTGEKLSETDLIEAVSRMEKQLKLDLTPFYCIPVWDKIPYYSVYLARFGDENIESENLAAMLDKQLSDVNEEYAYKRQTRRLGYPTIHRNIEIDNYSDSQIKRDTKSTSKAEVISGLQKKYQIMRAVVSTVRFQSIVI